jgi:hypothetical protein
MLSFPTKSVAQDKPMIRHAGSAAMLVLLLSLTPSGLVAEPVAFSPAAPNVGLAPMTVASTSETVLLIEGLIEIERDLLLGKLFFVDGTTSTEGSHFALPLQRAFPRIKEGLAKVGAPDLEPLLTALEGAKGKDGITAAYLDAIAGVKKAKQALNPTAQDIMAAVVEAVAVAEAQLDPSGTTSVAAYQDAWGLIMAARGQLDVLLMGDDAAVKQTATKLALAIDDVILFAPDPSATAPVAFDKALVTKLVGTLKGEIGSA